MKKIKNDIKTIFVSIFKIMNRLFVLNNNNLLFSTYAKNKSIIFTSYDSPKILKLQKILNDHHNQTKTWIQNIDNVYLFAEDHIQIDLISTIYCNLYEPVENINVTFFDTQCQTDLNFLHQFNELMNISVYVIKDFEYIDHVDNPLLSLQGFFIEYKSENIELNHNEYLDAMFEIDTYT